MNVAACHSVSATQPEHTTTAPTKVERKEMTQVELPPQ